MSAIAPMHELRLTYSMIQSMKAAYGDFFKELQLLVFKANRFEIPFGYVCQYIMDVEINERYIKKIHNQSKVAEVHHDLFLLKTNHHEGYHHLCNLLTNNRLTGYNNICRIIIGDEPEDLKEGNDG